MSVDRPTSDRPARIPFGGEAEASISIEAPPAPVASLLSDGETVLMVVRPSLWMVGLWSIGALGVIAGMVFALAWGARFEWTGWTESQAFGLGLLLAGIRLVWQFLDWMNRLYVLTDRRVIRCRGIFQVDVFEARLDRIQQTSVLRLVRERLFGLGTIAFATAGTGTLDALWEAVDDPFAVHQAVTQAIDRYGRGAGGV
ncbi:MAG: PH domain-containing protein [Phycisphaeraceae bacterium]|nr:PH domain-containing protein [Phycisphaeraceae bacterium]